MARHSLWTTAVKDWIDPQLSVQELCVSVSISLPTAESPIVALLGAERAQQSRSDTQQLRANHNVFWAHFMCSALDSLVGLHPMPSLSTRP